MTKLDTRDGYAIHQYSDPGKIYSLKMALEVTEIFCVTIFILGGPGGEGGPWISLQFCLLVVKNLLYNQRVGSGLSDFGSGSMILMTKNWKKNYSWKKKFDIFLIKIAIYLSLDLHKGRPSYRRSLQPSQENIQHFET